MKLKKEPRRDAPMNEKEAQNVELVLESFGTDELRYSAAPKCAEELKYSQNYLQAAFEIEERNKREQLGEGNKSADDNVHGESAGEQRQCLAAKILDAEIEVSTLSCSEKDLCKQLANAVLSGRPEAISQALRALVNVKHSGKAVREFLSSLFLKSGVSVQAADDSCSLSEETSVRYYVDLNGRCSQVSHGKEDDRNRTLGFFGRDSRMILQSLIERVEEQTDMRNGLSVLSSSIRKKVIKTTQHRINE